MCLKLRSLDFRKLRGSVALRIRASLTSTQRFAAISAGGSFLHQPRTLRCASASKLSVLQENKSDRHQNEEQCYKTYGK